MHGENLIGWLAEQPEHDPAQALEVERRMRDNMADVFRPVLRDMEAHGHTEYWLPGGRGSCKSSSASLMIAHALYADAKANALIIRKVAVTLRDSVFAQMLWALERLGLDDDWTATVSPMEITNKITGQQILFRGLDEPRKIKSIKPKHGYIKIVWIEEMDECKGYDEVHNVLESALRGKGNRGYLIGSYNPPKSANSWVNKEVLADNPERLVHRSTYQDVPREWLGEQFWAEAERIRELEPLRWRHVYGGEATGDGGNVFSNLQIRRLTRDELAYCQSHAMHGLDFGYSCDPSALMSTAYSETPDGKRILYIWQEWVKAGAGFDALEKAIRRQCGKAEVWCDTEPRTIAELRGRGLNVAAARKGKNSRAFGTQWLEEMTEIVIDSVACPEAVKEFSAFEHARNKDGSWRADYQDGNDHTVDGTRYACWRLVYRNKRKNYFSGKGARR